MTGTTVRRQVVRIDESRCNGCGACVSPCAEGAIEIADGKARVLRDELCDGAGFCLGVCPTGALTIEEREATPFDHEAVGEHAAAAARTYIPQACSVCGADENHAPLVPIRTRGTSTWVCAHCLPTLIHGA
jgi:Na+-translocating ferredoxin:NAD+ oxidoreductase RNF subunit RnfB